MRHSDVCLLLRSHAEHSWLRREVLPVLGQLELPGLLPPDQLDAARAYLEVMWMEAQLHAWESDAAYGELEGLCENGPALRHPACRYYRAVRRLRESLARRVAERLGEAQDAALDATSWRHAPARATVGQPQATQL